MRRSGRTRITRGVLALAVIVLGLVSLCGGVYLFMQTMEINNLKKECTAHEAGVVREILSKTETTGTGGQRRQTVTYFPVVAYSANGVEYVEQSSFKVTRYKYTVGKDVTVFYNPSNPEQIYISDADIMPTVVAAIGAALLLLGIAMLIKKRRS